MSAETLWQSMQAAAERAANMPAWLTRTLPDGTKIGCAPEEANNSPTMGNKSRCLAS